MKKVNEFVSGKDYYLHWSNNPAYWNDNLENLKKKNIVHKVNGKYFTIVTCHYSGDFSIIDCTCNLDNGDFYLIDTENLYEI
jgi:hypothetical protein